MLLQNDDSLSQSLSPAWPATFSLVVQLINSPQFSQVYGLCTAQLTANATMICKDLHKDTEEACAHSRVPRAHIATAKKMQTQHAAYSTMAICTRALWTRLLLRAQIPGLPSTITLIEYTCTRPTLPHEQLRASIFSLSRDSHMYRRSSAHPVQLYTHGCHQ